MSKGQCVRVGTFVARSPTLMYRYLLVVSDVNFNVSVPLATLLLVLKGFCCSSTCSYIAMLPWLVNTQLGLPAFLCGNLQFATCIIETRGSKNREISKAAESETRVRSVCGCLET